MTVAKEEKPVEVSGPFARYTPVVAERNKKSRDLRRRAIRTQNERSKMKSGDSCAPERPRQSRLFSWPSRCADAV